MAAAQVIEIGPENVRQSAPVSEFDLLRACCRPAGNAAIAATLHPGIDWDGLLKQASYHRILPALCSFLRNRAEVPANIQALLSSRILAHNLRVLRFLAELSAILREFRASGIEVILHKGPALARRLYGDPAMREFGDLDLLVRPGDVPRARVVLQQLGFGPRLDLSARQEREYLHSGYEYAFSSSAEPNLIELQWQIVPRFYSVAFSPEGLFRRSVEFEIEGQRARMLSNEDLLLTLCVHAAKHCWPQLGMVRDIAALARQPLDWQWITTESQRLGIVRIVCLSLLLARNLLNLPLPPEPAMNPEVEKLEAVALTLGEYMRSNTALQTESLGYFRFMSRMRERWQDRLRFATRLAFTPSVSEWNAVHLPDFLFPLYYGVRIWRLLKRAM